ncbi:hypothetical protein V1512DRAFT_252981 [Lipomyces arxii]|uniref:uncharacterized protein n=1 Tax=Lipomyces arxii TaxID=56418 RepID=UPI0034CF307A
MDHGQDLSGLIDGTTKLGYCEAMNWLSRLCHKHSSLRTGVLLIAQFTQLFKDMDLFEHCLALYLARPLEVIESQRTRVHVGFSSQWSRVCALLSFMGDTRNTAETKELQAKLSICLIEGANTLTGSSPDRGHEMQLSSPRRNCLKASQKLSTLSSDNDCERAPDNIGPQDELNEFQGNFDFDDWLQKFNLESNSPLDAF